VSSRWRSIVRAPYEGSLLACWSLQPHDHQHALSGGATKTSSKDGRDIRSSARNSRTNPSDPKQIKVEDCRIFLPKAGWVRMVKHREIIGDVKNVTVSRHGTYWFVSVQVQREVDEPMLKIGAAKAEIWASSPP
jgi:transposase